MGLIFILLSCLIISPFFFHLMGSLGVTVVMQDRDSPLPSLTVLSLGSIKTDGAVPVIKQTQISSFNQNI